MEMKVSSYRSRNVSIVVLGRATADARIMRGSRVPIATPGIVDGVNPSTPDGITVIPPSDDTPSAPRDEDLSVTGCDAPIAPGHDARQPQAMTLVCPSQ